MVVTCPKCRKALDATGRAPGSSIICPSCGNMTAAPLRGSRRSVFVTLAICFAVLVIPCTGILAAIAIPNFVRFKARARQAECKSNLKGWYTAQRLRMEGPSLSVDEVGFTPERGNRYAYFAGPGPIEDRSGPSAEHGRDAVGYGVDTLRYTGARPITLEQLPPDVARLAGISGDCPDCAITMVCAGNVDTDDGLDVWSISTVQRTGPDGERYMAGEPVHHVDDLRD